MRRSLFGLLLLGTFSLACAQDPPPKDEPPDQPQGKVRLDFNTGGHHDTIREMLFTPDGKRLITVGNDRTIQVWNAKTGERERLWRLPGSKAVHVAIAPDGKTVAVASELPGAAGGQQESIWMVKVEDSSIQVLDKLPKAKLTNLAFSPTGDRLAIHAGQGMVIRDLKEQRQIFKILKAGEPHGLRFSGDGNRLYVQIGLQPDKTSTNLYELPPQPGKKLVEIANPTAELKGRVVDVDPKGQRVLTATGGKKAALHAYSDRGVHLQTYPLGTNRPWVILAAHFRGDQEVLVLVSRYRANEQETAGLVLNMATGAVQETFKGPVQQVYVTRGAIAPDNQRIALTDNPQYQVVLRNPADEKEKFRLGELSRPASLLGWSADSKVVAWGAPAWNDRADRLKALKQAFHLGELKALGKEGLKDIQPGRQAPDGWSVRQQPIGNMQVLRNGEVVWEKAGGPYSWTFFSDGQGGKRVVIGWQEHPVTLHEAETGKELARFGPPAMVHELAVSPDRRYLLVARSSPELWLHRLDQPGREPLLKLLFTETDWIIWTEAGYYAASPGGEKLIGWRVDNGPGQLATFHPAERFRKELYRPDIIQLIFEKGSVEEALKAARTKVIDLEKLLPPKCALQLLEQKGGQVRLKATAEAQVRDQPVTALRLLLDGRPWPGALQELKPGDKPEATWTIDLPEGEHHLAVLARSRDASALSNVLAVKHVNPAKQPVLHVLAIGIDKYRAPARPLDFAVADARAVATAFEKICTGPNSLFRPGQRELLLDANASRPAVLAALAELRKGAKPNDLVVVFFAGHGVKEKDQFYLLTAEADVKSALSGADLKGLGNFPCQVLLVLDACRAAAGARAFVDDLTRSLTDDEVGVAVLCAALAHEESRERKELKQGLFTHALVRALTQTQDVKCNRFDRRQYLHHLYDDIFDDVRQLSEDRQHPFLSLPWVVESFPLRQLPMKSPGER